MTKDRLAVQTRLRAVSRSVTASAICGMALPQTNIV